MQKNTRLTKEKELSLFESLNNGDASARDELVLGNMSLVKYYANKNKGYGIPIEDLIQEGTIGLLKAIDSFDMAQNTRLATFASSKISAEILEYCIKNWKIVKIATTKPQRKLFFNLRKYMNADSSKISNISKVADELDVSEKDIRLMQMRIVNFDEPYDIIETDDDAPISTPSNKISSNNTTPLDLCESAENIVQQDKLIAALLRGLSPTQRLIIKERYLLDKKTKLAVLGKKLGCTYQNISLIEKTAIAAIKKKIKTTAIQKYL